MEDPEVKPMDFGFGIRGRDLKKILARTEKCSEEDWAVCAHFSLCDGEVRLVFLHEIHLVGEECGEAKGLFTVRLRPDPLPTASEVAEGIAKKIKTIMADFLSRAEAESERRREIGYRKACRFLKYDDAITVLLDIY